MQERIEIVKDQKVIQSYLKIRKQIETMILQKWGVDLSDEEKNKRIRKEVLKRVQRAFPGKRRRRRRANSDTDDSEGDEEIYSGTPRKGFRKKRRLDTFGGSLEMIKKYRRNTPEVELASILEKVVNQLMTDAGFSIFNKLVKKREGPNYYKIVKTPMHLELIRDVRCPTISRLQSFLTIWSNWFRTSAIIATLALLAFWTTYRRLRRTVESTTGLTMLLRMLPNGCTQRRSSCS